MLNTAPRHDDMWGGGKAPCILQLQHSMEVRGQLRSSHFTYLYKIQQQNAPFVN